MIGCLFWLDNFDGEKNNKRVKKYNQSWRKLVFIQKLTTYFNCKQLEYFRCLKKWYMMKDGLLEPTTEKFRLSDLPKSLYNVSEIVSRKIFSYIEKIGGQYKINCLDMFLVIQENYDYLVEKDRLNVEKFEEIENYFLSNPRFTKEKQNHDRRSRVIEPTIISKENPRRLAKKTNWMLEKKKALMMDQLEDQNHLYFYQKKGQMRSL